MGGGRIGKKCGEHSKIYLDFETVLQFFLTSIAIGRCLSTPKNALLFKKISSDGLAPGKKYSEKHNKIIDRKLFKNVHYSIGDCPSRFIRDVSKKMWKNK